VARLAYRDPEHLPERLALYAADTLAEPSSTWAAEARKARPLALAQPQVAVFVYLLTAILGVLRARGDEIATAADLSPGEVHETKEEP
jgi:hypothetical protein